MILDKLAARFCCSHFAAALLSPQRASLLIAVPKDRNHDSSWRRLLRRSLPPGTWAVTAERHIIRRINTHG